MTRPSLLIWFALVVIVLLPSAAGRFLLDLAGGLLIALLALPILITGVGWLGWRFLQSRLVQCEACGASVMSESTNCPICGSNLTEKIKTKTSKSAEEKTIPASSVTIDVIAKDAD